MNVRRSMRVLAALAVLAATAPHASADLEIRLRVEGESPFGDRVVRALAASITFVPATTEPGRCTLVLTRELDPESIHFADTVADATILPRLVIDLHESGSKEPVIRYVLAEAEVESISVSALAGGTAVEQVQIVSRRLTYYRVSDARQEPLAEIDLRK